MGFDPNAGGGKTVSFDNIGDKVEGVILSADDKNHARDVDTGALLYWDAEKTQPRYQWLFELQVAPTEDNPTGVVKVYAKGGNFTPVSGTGKSLQEAIKDAVRASGAKLIEEGGTLAIAHTGLGEKKKAAFNAPKLYAARYTPPAPRAASINPFDD